MSMSRSLAECQGARDMQDQRMMTSIIEVQALHPVGVYQTRYHTSTIPQLCMLEAARALQDMNQPELSSRVRQVYGDTDPRQLWNASFAASPANWLVGSQPGMCAAMAPPQSGSVAIVGNGPLTDAQRQMIRRQDRVVRFNALNNMCAAPSPLHLAVVFSVVGESLAQAAACDGSTFLPVQSAAFTGCSSSSFMVLNTQLSRLGCSADD